MNKPPPPSLAGRWTLAQIEALSRAGWLDDKVILVEVTNQNEACRWFVIFSRGQR